MSRESEISPQIAEARMVVLRTWLPHFLRDYAHRFPASGRPAPPPPFPACWEEHAELVTQLQLLKMRADQIEDGETDAGYRIEDWFAFLDDRFLPLVRLIGRICRHGHVVVTRPRAATEAMPSPPPPLPGAARPRPEAAPAAPPALVSADHADPPAGLGR